MKARETVFHLRKYPRRKQRIGTVASTLARNRHLTTTTNHVPYMTWTLLRREGRKEERLVDLENGKFSITTTSILHGVWVLLLRYHHPLK